MVYRVVFLPIVRGARLWVALYPSGCAFCRGDARSGVPVVTTAIAAGGRFEYAARHRGIIRPRGAMVSGLLLKVTTDLPPRGSHALQRVTFLQALRQPTDCGRTKGSLGEGK